MTNEEKKVTEYTRAVYSIELELNELLQDVHDHFEVSPEELNWSHVGSAKALLKALRQARHLAPNSVGEPQ